MSHSDQELVLERTFDAPRELVWKAWTNSDFFAKWYGKPGDLEEVDMDVTEGGAWENITVMPDGSEYPAMGIFTVVNKPEELEFRYLNVDNPEDDKFETMHVALEEMDGITHMVFRQSGNLPAEEYAEGLSDGWSGFFDALDDVLKD